MKRSKIRRRSRVFRRRRGGAVFGKVLLWLLVIPVAVGGYFLAQYLFEGGGGKPAIAPTAPTESTTATTPSQTPSATPTVPNVSDGANVKNMQALYLPASALYAPETWTATLEAASAAGYNAVIVDVKDADGRLWYVSSSPLAQTARAVQTKAVSVEALTALRDAWQEKWGLALIPRVYAFRDHTAPRYLENARVTVQGDTDAVWYDDKPDEGGRRWLNPYAEEARGYILEIAAELHGIGFPLLMLDGVQFPDQEARAYYGDAEQTALPRGDVLAGFAARMNEAVGKDGWMLTVGGMAAVGEKTGVYGANPATFGVGVIAPWALPSSFGGKLTLGGATVASPNSHPYEAATLLFGQLKARLQLMESPPQAMPWLQAGGYNTADVAAQVTALREQLGADAPYVLYDPDGAYTF